MNSTSTQLSDFLRRSAELLVLILALVIYNLLKKDLEESQKHKLRMIMIRSVGGMLLLTSLVLITLALRNMLNPSIPEGNVWLGLSVALLGVIFNGSFMIRYTLFNRSKQHTVMASQVKLYQTKTLIDISVVISLGAVLLLEANMTTFWIDTIVTVIIAIYLFIRGIMLLTLMTSGFQH